jgi:glycosyltransferase involved in cell wall biosynthesis
MKRILYLSYYFEPDLCAGSFRNSPLAKELANQLKGKAHIDVVTTLPNRYSTFSTEAKIEEVIENLNIRRINLPSHKGGFLDQIIAFKEYYFRTKKIIKESEYDIVFASSSRLFTAFLGYQIARKRKIPLILDIRDIFTDTLNDVIPYKGIKFFLLPILRFLEGIIFNYAVHINLISAGFEQYFKVYKKANFSFFTNGIDQEFIQLNDFQEKLSKSAIVITYAGNIGEGQGLHKIIPKAAKLLGHEYHFRIIGDGGAKLLLEKEIHAEKVTNVSIENPMKRNELLQIYRESHFLFMHLNDYKAFEKVLPSKVFELGAFPRPIIAGVNGYSRLFIEKYVLNSILIKPTNFLELVEALKNYKYTIIQREEFIAKFDRRIINKDFASVIIKYLE